MIYSELIRPHKMTREPDSAMLTPTLAPTKMDDPSETDPA